MEGSSAQCTIYPDFLMGYEHGWAMVVFLKTCSKAAWRKVPNEITTLSFRTSLNTNEFFISGKGFFHIDVIFFGKWDKLVKFVKRQVRWWPERCVYIALPEMHTFLINVYRYVDGAKYILISSQLIIVYHLHCLRIPSVKYGPLCILSQIVNPLWENVSKLNKTCPRTTTAYEPHASSLS